MTKMKENERKCKKNESFSKQAKKRRKKKKKRAQNHPRGQKCDFVT